MEITENTHTHKCVDFWKSRHKPSGVTCQAPQESFGSKDGKMAFETCYWLALKKKWSEVIKELTESNLLMYLDIVEQLTPRGRCPPPPPWGKIAEVCKPYKIRIQTFSLLPIMMGCAGTGVKWCLFLHSPSPGSLGERWGGRKIARKKATGGQAHFTVLSQVEIWLFSGASLALLFSSP